MEEALRGYARYERRAVAVKEVGEKLVDLIADNVKSIERYKEYIAKAEEGKDNSYYQRQIEELAEENALLLDLEQYYRCKLLGDGRRIEL